MPFKTGTWGEQAKLRNCRRREYFNNYNATRPQEPDKTKVRQQALKLIKIPKGQMCQDCKSKFAIDRHHPDYSKPLEVEFLCRSCHKKK